MTICMGLLRTETAAVLGGTDAQGADERAAHRLGGAVAAGAGGLLDAAGGVLEAAARGLEPRAVDVAAGRHPDLGGEGAGELARGRAGPVCGGGRGGVGRRRVERSTAGPGAAGRGRRPGRTAGR